MNEFKNIAHYYLGTGLMCEVKDGRPTKISEMNAVYSDGSVCFMDLIESEWGFDDIKPILHPLSCLTEEITVKGYNDGKSFVPQHELADLIKGDSSLGVTGLKGDMDCIAKAIEHQNITETCKWWVVNGLIQWHFNVFNLPEDQYINTKNLVT